MEKTSLIQELEAEMADALQIQKNLQERAKKPETMDEAAKETLPHLQRSAAALVKLRQKALDHAKEKERLKANAEGKAKP